MKISETKLGLLVWLSNGNVLEVCSELRRFSETLTDEFEKIEPLRQAAVLLIGLPTHKLWAVYSVNVMNNC
jgi:hypothetical protein